MIIVRGGSGGAEGRRGVEGGRQMEGVEARRRQDEGTGE